MDEINDATDRVIAGLEGRPLQGPAAFNAGDQVSYTVNISSVEMRKRR